MRLSFKNYRIFVFFKDKMNVLCRVCLYKVDPTSSTSLFTTGNNGELISEMLINFASVNVGKFLFKSIF